MTAVLQRLIAFTAMVALAPSIQVAPQTESPIAAALRRPPSAAAWASFDEDMSAVSQFYARRDYRPAWSGAADANPAGQSVMRALARADEDGLNPEDYLPVERAALAARGTQQSATDFDVLLSLLVVKFARDVGWGLTVPSEVDSSTMFANRPFAPDAVLEQVAAAPDAGDALRAFAPPSFVYTLLKQALATLRASRARGGWGRAIEGPTLRLGDEGPRVAQLRALLVERGDLSAGSAGSRFDAELVAALKLFQDRHGLKADGIYGKNVVSELNVPLPTRIQQVRLGLERLRWLPRTQADRRIAVNLADFKAYVFDGDRVTFETRAVVGKLYHETPMFAGTMTYLVINPYWNVPPSITRAEILPKVKADPDYLAKNHMEYNGTSVRQLPGPWNSLGRFKFMFPNPYNVYLHDTPARALFSEPDRAFSHGCVRLEKPSELAELLLASQGWTSARIKAAVDSGAETVVNLDKPIPVYISYLTAFLAPDGLLHYRRDVYGRDRKLLEALEARRPGSWGR